MSKYYAPIPGVVRGRGRPSREELEARRKYWEGIEKGAEDKPVQVTNIVVSSVKPQVQVESKKAQVTFKKISKEDVPEEIQKLLEACKEPFTKEENNKINEILSKLPPSKRGRKSKEEMELRQNIKNQINSLIVDKLRSNGSTIELENAVTNAPSEVKLETVPSNQVTNNDIGYQFKNGDSVKLIPQLHVGPEDYKRRGTVVRHDIGSRFVYTRWDNGMTQYYAAKSLMRYYPTLEPKKPLYKLLEGVVSQYSRSSTVIKMSEVRSEWIGKTLERCPKYKEDGIEVEMMSVLLNLSSECGVAVERDEE